MTNVVHIKRFPINGGFYAINIFDVIFSVQKLNAVELNHERIHTAQQRELLYIGFYLRLRLPHSRQSSNKIGFALAAHSVGTSLNGSVC